MNEKYVLGGVNEVKKIEGTTDNSSLFEKKGRELTAVISREYIANKQIRYSEPKQFVQRKKP